MAATVQDRVDGSHVILATPPHRQLRAQEWQYAPDKMSHCDALFWKMQGDHEAWRKFRNDHGFDSRVATGLFSLLALMTGGGAALSFSGDAMEELELRAKSVQSKEAYNKECMQAPSAQPASAPQPLEMSEVNLPATVGGEVMLPEPPIGWVLAGYGVLGVAVATTAAAIYMAPELAIAAEATSFIPQGAQFLSGLRFAIP